MKGSAEDERVVALAGARTPLTRAGGSATLLFDGSVLLVGGSTIEVPGPATADLLPAAAEVFVPLCVTPGCR